MKDLVAAIIIEEKRLLLLHNIKNIRPRVEPPGGKRKYDEVSQRYKETLRECNEREVQEKLGIEIRTGEKLGAYRTKSPEGDFMAHMYFSTITYRRPRIMEPKNHSKLGWYSYEDLRRLRTEGLLVPNLADALMDLSPYLA